MRLHLSLTTNVLILVALPLLIQLILLGSLASLESQAEQALRISTHSKKISDAINQISADVFDIISTYGNETSLEFIPLDDISGQDAIKRVRRDYQELKELTGDKPEIGKAVIDSQIATEKAFTVLRDLKLSFMKTGSLGRDARKPVWRKLRDEMKGILFDQLVSIGNEQKRLSDKAPEVQAVYRERAQQAMLGFGIIDLAMGLALALYLTRGITTRLKKVSDNTYRLASGMPLHPVLHGNDEIARLDQVFHKMAGELRESSRKERAIVDNARDFICTIDSQGRFIAANPAAETLLGVEPEDLQGKHFIDLVIGSDTNKALDYLEQLKLQKVSAAMAIEMLNRERLSRRSGRLTGLMKKTQLFVSFTT